MTQAQSNKPYFSRMKSMITRILIVVVGGSLAIGAGVLEYQARGASNALATTFSSLALIVLISILIEI